ncbi:NAD(P)-dependent oxidoreductase [Pseudoduganella danionis]|uniref:SDR family oxidoreductase n=1 Tax=Pseudoduganella danionis TaxID=1890295 RepID=UPI0035B4036C
MKLLLTGAGGLLGSAVSALAQQHGDQCHAMARPALDTPVAALAAQLRGADLLLHAAANTNVEQCEREPDACYRDNFLLSELLARAAAQAQVPLLLVSSTGLYGTADSAPYREYAATVPTTHHHRSKLLAEQAVLAAAPGNLVLRTGWLFGGAASLPKNFVARRIDEARKALAQGDSMAANTEQHGVPCWNVDIAGRMLALARSGASGVYNCVNSGTATRYEYVQAVLQLAGIALPLQPGQAAGFQRIAQVSPNEMADNWKMRMQGWPEMPHWRASLERYLQSELADY